LCRDERWFCIPLVLSLSPLDAARGDPEALEGSKDERVARSRAPSRIPADAGDAELSRELQMFGEVIAIH
jgi:hypothetical protein